MLQQAIKSWIETRRQERGDLQTPIKNLLNLGYEVLKGEIYKAIMYAHLDPYLGYLHLIQFAKPYTHGELNKLIDSLYNHYPDS